MWPSMTTPGHAMRRPDDAAQLLDVEMKQVAWGRIDVPPKISTS